MLPVLITLFGVALLVGLGTWQVQRMIWKDALLQRIETRMAAAPVSLPPGVINPEDWEYRRVGLSGRFLHDQELHLYAIGANGRPGFRVITPLLRGDGLPVLVDRGWVPEKLKDPGTRLAGQITGIVDIEGLIARSGAKARFTPENDLVANRWYFLDLEEMALAVGLGDHMPVVVVATAGKPNPGGYPQRRAIIPGPSDNHLIYAITWYSLALGLAGVFLLYRFRPQA